MPNYTRDLTLILHMKVYCKQIVETLDRFENSFDIFLKDNDFQDSISN